MIVTRIIPRMEHRRLISSRCECDPHCPIAHGAIAAKSNIRPAGCLPEPHAKTVSLEAPVAGRPSFRLALGHPVIPAFTLRRSWSWGGALSLAASSSNEGGLSGSFRYSMRLKDMPGLVIR